MSLLRALLTAFQPLVPADRLTPIAGSEPGVSQRSRVRPAGSGAVALCLAWAIGAAGCGGGGLGSGGTGAPLGGGSGTVTGFGSVVVDGLALDDRNAAVVTESDDGRLVPGAAELGQRVDFELDAAGLPTRLRIDPQLIGPITEVQPLLRRIVVLGRTVQLNVNAVDGPSTVLAGVTDLSVLLPGRWVEVHGVEGVAPLSGAPLLQATRIRALAAPAAALRVSGRVESVEAAGSRVRLGALTVDLSGAQRVPAGQTVAVEDRVTVLARPGDVAGPASAPVLTARVLVARAASPLGQRVLLAGKIRSLEPGRSVVVEGVQVFIGSATVTGGDLRLGQYVRVEGLAAGPRQVEASAIGIRAGSPDGDIELKGSLTGLATDGRSFQLRGARVVLPATGLELQDCTAALVDGAYVEVRGTVDLDAVRASRLRCLRAEPVGAVVERSGRAAEVDIAARSLVLQGAGAGAGAAALRVVWTDLTFFRDGTGPTVALLAGRALEVEGVLRADGVLVARRIRLDD